MGKIQALKELGYRFITKNKYTGYNPHKDYVTAWIYKPRLTHKEDLCDDELIFWTNGEECGLGNWEYWTQIQIQNCKDFDFISEDATEPYEIK